MRNRSRTGRIISVWVLLVGLALVFSGCEKPSAPPPVTLRKPPRRRAAKAQPAKDQVSPKKKPGFSYNPQGLIDPFKPFIQIGSPGKTVPGVPKTPLQEYDLSQLRLTAIIWLGSDASRAMVEDSAGKGFTVQKGTHIGKRGGKVKAIRLDRVIIEEPVRGYGKQSRAREIVMKMPEEGGKK